MKIYTISDEGAEYFTEIIKKSKSGVLMAMLLSVFWPFLIILLKSNFFRNFDSGISVLAMMVFLFLIATIVKIALKRLNTLNGVIKSVEIDSNDVVSIYTFKGLQITSSIKDIDLIKGFNRTNKYNSIFEVDITYRIENLSNKGKSYYIISTYWGLWEDLKSDLTRKDEIDN
ncbi:hypothetical protein [Pedobacter sp. UC225_65]|uniref:hypothetical protein n=1 Tax=Pedobacter sp. UC225_65 TaxID=3350173 RepID=UPI00367055F9